MYQLLDIFEVFKNTLLQSLTSVHKIVYNLCKYNAQENT